MKGRGRNAVPQAGMLGLQILNGVVYAAILFTVALGFSIVFGVMRVLHFGHAGAFMFGAYLTWALQARGLSIGLVVVVVALATAAFAFVVERLLISRIYRRDPLDQVLLTLGLGYVVGDLILAVAGGDVRAVAEPEWLSGVVQFADQTFPIYRLFVAGFALTLAATVWLLLQRTRWGAILRAAVEDQQMVAAIGINTRTLFSVVFVAATVLTAIGGVIAAPITQAYIGMDVQNLTLSLIVVIIGGMGTVQGVAAGALLIGVVDTFAKVLLPEQTSLFMYGLMMLVLALRPQGLFGVRNVERV